MIGEILTCTLCGHQWMSRGKAPPLRCPNPRCQSPDWDIPSTPIAHTIIGPLPKAEPTTRKELELPD